MSCLRELGFIDRKELKKAETEKKKWLVVSITFL
jgi:hypothetical protein